MSRVSQETLNKLNEFFDTLPDEARSKCSLCNETLTHIVKSAEVQTGAPTATVTRELSERINEGAAPGDVVNGHALNERVRQNEGLNDHKIRKPENKPKPKPKKKPDPYFNPTSIKSEEFSKAFDVFIKEVAQAKKEHWETTSKEAVSQCVRSINYYIGE